jgi:PIN domain nuclease of toxin-antitoxin system
MNLLLDTNAFIYWLYGTLPLRTKRRIERASGLLLSVVSPWEIANKSSISGKRPGDLRLPTNSEVEQGLADLGARLLPVTMRHSERLYTLPLHHKDPFDRMIIVQALEEQCAVLTSDERFPLYESVGLQVLWD